MKNVGVALVPRLSVRAEIENGRLAEINIRELQLTRELNIIYRRNAQLSHAAEAFLEAARSPKAVAEKK